MISQNAPQEEQEAKAKKTEKNYTSSVDKALRVMENTEEVKDSRRQIIDGSLLGTCLVFIAAMLGLQIKQMDTPLTVALMSFAIAIPMLVLGFLLSTYKPKPVQGWQILEAIIIYGWIVEACGGIAVAVGVFAVIAHLSSPAFITSLWIAVLVTVGMLILPLAGLLIFAGVQLKKEQKKQ